LVVPRRKNSLSLQNGWVRHLECSSELGRTTLREISDRRLGHLAWAQPDEEEQSLSRPALGGIAAQETGALAGRQVGLCQAQDERIGLTADLVGRKGVGVAARGGHQGSPGLLPRLDECLDRLGEASALRSFVPDRRGAARACPEAGRLVMNVPLTSKVTKAQNISAHIRVDPPGAGLKTTIVILTLDLLNAVLRPAYPVQAR